ncbi:luciferase family protein [Amycolatopsis rhabdoformis]|uniref:Luciferase family protein n=1 Tax=Amycolatopsis rhabdoformis TaxID=1448059 RepID=A0ABZ1IJZ5_9PSEU|nr:luciferase family protein [Amycolatopsis rhabdoformis]WSE34196.1 luciferase family protein [Amycolatopsis rhabdoformis]
MTQFGAPVVAGRGDETGPLVVLLHGRGARESDIIGLADALPAGFRYTAVRAPIAEHGGFAWFANRGIGRPVPDSLRATMDWFREWLDATASPGRPVFLVGFSGGAAFAGGLLLDDPDRYAGAAILYGTLPFEAGVPTEPARLAGVPVFVAQGEHDQVIPRELLDRTWEYLTAGSGAPTIARRDAVGHEIAPLALGALSGWLAERAGFLARRGVPAPAPTRWHGRADGLPQRRGPRPRVSVTIPQQQLTDTAPAELQEKLFAELSALPGVRSSQSAISVPGARGLMLADGQAGPAEAFLVPRAGEFAHLHPSTDGSLHVALPVALAAEAIERGWAVAHPLAGIRLTPGMVLVYGPRDQTELDVVAEIVATSHSWAAGQEAPADR